MNFSRQPALVPENFRQGELAAHVLVDPDDFVWCVTAFHWTDGKVHAYGSRWPKKPEYLDVAVFEKGVRSGNITIPLQQSITGDVGK